MSQEQQCVGQALLLDVAEVVAHHRTRAQKPPRGVPAGKHAFKAKPAPRLTRAVKPRSVVVAIEGLASAKSGLAGVMLHPNLATSREHVNRMEVMHRTLARALEQSHQPSSSSKRRPSVSAAGTADAFVPVCTVDMDNEQLRWGRAAPLCTAGQACVATRLAHAPGPLHAFTAAGCAPTLCLLCLRLHAEMINKATMAASGTTASLMPPYTNLVNCAGGYFDWAMGVDPNSQRVFSRQCAIVGACPNLTVQYSPLDKVWWVDQSAIIWRPDFRHGASGAGVTANC
jgi:hypothetical protein